MIGMRTFRQTAVRINSRKTIIWVFVVILLGLDEENCLRNQKIHNLYNRLPGIK